MFEHSVKVPRHYKVAANIVKKVATERGSVKSLLYDNKLRHFRTNVLFALITECIKHSADLDKMFEECSLLKNESRLDPWLAKVLTTEMLYGKRVLPGNSKPEQTILSYKEQFEKYMSENQDVLKTEAIRRPRYVRINTNLLTTSDAIGAFQDEGYHFVRCTSGSYEDYLKQIQSLTEYDFTQDFHIKTIFVFPPGTKLHDHELYWENKIILQDKATALPVHLLAPPPGSVVLDMCAAPGMKTTQLAAYMRNEGKIYAVERNEQRYQTLCEFVQKTGSKCVETLCKDSLKIKRGECDDVEYILLDPSCSGSGMELTVHNYIEATRLAKLTSLQEKFLKHAMNSFPKAKRIVYSTCSLFPEENERVITNIVMNSRAKWRVQDVKELLKGQWNNFGSGMYGSIGTRCLYARPQSDFTTGFFLAVLDREPKELGRNTNAENGGEKDNSNGANENRNKRQKMKSAAEVTKESLLDGLEENYTDQKEVGAEETSEKVSKKKKKKKSKIADDNEVVSEGITNDIQLEGTIIDDSVETQVLSPKKKKKRDNNKINNCGTDELTNENSVETTQDNVEKPIKKKKRKDNTNNQLHDNEIEVEESSEPVKKKKRKRKDSPNINETEIEDGHSQEPLKKKNKKNKCMKLNADL